MNVDGWYGLVVAIGLLALGMGSLLLALARRRRSAGPGGAAQNGAPSQEGLARVELHIPRMVCEGCAEGIEDALRALPGVHHAAARLRKKQVSVRYDPRRVEIAALEETLEQAGFAVGDP